MEVGDIVHNSYHSIERYGIVKTTEKKNDGWKYVTVDWIDDEVYEQSVAWRNKIGAGRDYYLKEYRCDQIRRIDLKEVGKLIKTLKKAKKEISAKEQEIAKLKHINLIQKQKLNESSDDESSSDSSD